MSAGQWVIGTPVALLILSPFIFLVGGPIVVWAFFLTAIIPIAFWTDKANGLGWADRLWRTALLVLWVPVGVLGFLAPARALVLWAWLPFADTRFGREMAAAPPIALDIPLLNGFIGLCGVAFAFYGGQRSLRQLRQIRNQLERLPRAKAASAAMGLAELSGVVRKVEDPALRAEKCRVPLAWAPELPVPEADAVLWKTTLNLGETLRYELRQCFYLEDSSGRILVDPGTVVIKDRPGSFLTASGLQGLALGRGKRLLPGPNRSKIEVLSLHEGQELYVIGTVQPRPDAPGGKVLAADPRPMEQGLFTRLFPTSHMAKAGGDPTHANSLFLVSDARESLTRLAVESSAWGTLWASLGWLVLCLLLAIFELQRVGPGAWPPERFFPQPAPIVEPVAPRPPLFFFKVGATYYMAVWSKGRDVYGSSNGAWSLGGLEKLRGALREAAPRGVVLVVEPGGEAYAAEALLGQDLPLQTVAWEDYQTQLQSLGADLQSSWSLLNFARSYPESP